MTGSVRIRSNGFVTNDLIGRLSQTPGINRGLVEVFADTLRFAHGLLSRLPVFRQETREEKQRVIAILMLVRLVEIAESTFILAAHGIRQELQSLFRIFLDAYFLLANVCSDPDFVPVFFQTDEHTRLKLMNAGAKYDDDLFKLINGYATAEVKDGLERKIKQERIEAFNSFVFAQRVGCEAIYDSMYRLCSASIHSTPRCLEAYVEEDGDRNICVIGHPGDAAAANHVLYDAHNFMLKALRGVGDLFAVADAGALAELESSREAAVKDVEA